MVEKIKNKLPIISLILMAVGQFLCASGSGNPATIDPLPDWVNNSANIANIVIGLMVFIPRTRVLAACLSVLITLISMITNYVVDGYDFFLQALVFNLVLIGVSLHVYFHYRRVSVLSR
jgi:hypothetical protein